MHLLVSSHLFFLLRSCQSLHSTFKESALGFTDLIDILLVSNLHYLFPAVCLVIGLVQFSSAAQSCPPLCDPMDCSMPGLCVHHQLPEFTQTHVHGVSDAIQPSHPLLSPSSPTLSLSQHQGLFFFFNLFILIGG